MSRTEPRLRRDISLRGMFTQHGVLLTRALVINIVGALPSALIPLQLGRVVGHRGDGLVGEVLLLAALCIAGVASSMLTNTTNVWLWLTPMFDAIRRAHRGSQFTADGRAPGDILSIGIDDSDQLGAAYDAVVRCAVSLATATVVIIVLSFTYWPAAIILPAGAVVLLIAQRRLLGCLKAAQEAERSKIGETVDVATDIAVGLRVIGSLRVGSFFRSRYSQASASLQAAGTHEGKVRGVYDAVSFTVTGLMVACVLGLGASAFNAGHLSAGDVVALAGYALYLVGAFTVLQDAIKVWARSRIAWKNIADLPQSSPPIAPQESSPEHMGQLHSLLQSLIDTGSGSAFVRVTSGDANSLSEAISRAVQSIDESATVELMLTSSTLVGVSLREVVDPSGQRERAVVESAMYAAAATDLITLFPGGWSGEIASRGGDLSGGQRQRLILARALARHPHVLVLAEPTSALDAVTAQLVARRTLDLRRDTITLVVGSGGPFAVVADTSLDSLELLGGKH